MDILDQPHQAYQYAPLKDDEIRLVRLHHSSRPEDIKCDIRHLQLRNSPPYIALSYTWGDPFGPARTIAIDNLDLPTSWLYSSRQQETITLNGQPMQIQRNLYLFFQHVRPDIDAPGSSGPCSVDLVENERLLRYEDPQSDTLGYFWVDAICIDQKNVAERNSQVKKMAEIYEKSKKIVAWLGPADQTTDLALVTITDLGNTFERLLAARGGTWDNIGPSDAPELDWPHLAAFRCIQRRAWRSRAWVIQEFSTPSRHPVAIQCSQGRFSWEQIVRTNFALLFTGVETNNVYNSRIVLFERLRNIRKDPSRIDLLNLKNLLKACWPYGATDPRDKLYAILSLTADGRHEDLLPDYSVPVIDLYRQLAIYIIKHDNNLDFLSFCDPARHLRTPSWVPDWSTWKQCGEIIRPKAWMLPSETVYHASGERAAKISFSSNEQHLIAEGFEIDIISEASVKRSVWGRPLNKDEEHEIAIAWSEFLFPSGQDENYVCGGTVLEAAGRILCADVSWQNAWTERVSITRGSSVSPLLRDLITGENKGPWHGLFSSLGVYYTTLWRRLIRTQKSYLGICSEHVRAGDRVCVLFGAQIPFVLRAAGACWEVIGEAYVHGIMDGEALNEESKIRTFELC